MNRLNDSRQHYALKNHEEIIALCELSNLKFAHSQNDVAITFIFTFFVCHAALHNKIPNE